MAVFTDEGKTYHVRVGKGDIGRYVLLPGDPFRTDLIASYFDDAKLVAHNREHKTWTGTLNGVPVLRRLHRHGLPVHRDLPGRADRLRARTPFHPRRHGRTRL